MRSFYKLDVLFVLRSAIIKRDCDSELSLEEKLVYDAVVKDIYGDYDLIDDSILFEEYFNDYFNDCYNNEKGYLSKEELDSIEDLLIFKGLLHFKGKTISLKEFYDYTFGSYYKEKYNMNLEEDRIAFLERLNGCLGEARVAKVNNDFIPRELVLDSDDLDILRLSSDGHKRISLCDKMKVSITTKNNPLIFISGLEPCKVKEFKIEDGKRFTFISISDLHLGSKLVNSLGILDDVTLEERLECFVAFKKQLIKDLKDNGINIDGVILVGDILDAFCEKFNVDDKRSLEFHLDMSKRRLYSVIKNFNSNNDNSLRIGDENTFVGFISGNHDNTLGRDLFIKIMNEFGEDIVFLGDGSARIKINDEYILFNHPNALDWGLPIRDNPYTTRRALERDIFHFEDYFKLCQRKHEFLSRLGLLHILGDTPRSSVATLVDLVNEDLRDNNSELYEFYKPFITRGNGDGTVVKRSCFEDAIRIIQDPDDPSIQTLGSRYKNGFDISRFIDYGKNNKNIREMLEERNICLVGDYLDPTLSIIGHFHTRLEGGQRVAYAKEDTVSGSDGNIPVVIEEGSTHIDRDTNEITYSATVCCLDIKDGVIDRIEIEPAIYVVKKDSVCQATRVVGTTSSVYVRKKTL